MTFSNINCEFLEEAAYKIFIIKFLLKKLCKFNLNMYVKYENFNFKILLKFY